jgi:acyl-CoA synthetase (AMP-forming)/AMP-acid ligase II
MNIAHLLLGSAREFRDLPALARGTTTHLTYRDLWRKVSVMSMHLRGRFGLERGDRVAFAMSNGVESIEVMYAIWHAGLCAVPMNAKLHAREFAFILENSGARLCFVTPDLAETIAEAAKDAPALKEIVDVTTRSYTFMEVGDPIALAEAEPTDLAWLFYTSGTTGRPKGAMLTHRNLLAMTLNYFADVDRPPPGGSIVHAAPISHGSGLWNFALLARGAVQVFPESGKYEVPETVELMNRWPDCSIFLAPTMVKRLIEHGSVSELRPDSLRLVTYGGAPMYVSDLKHALDLLGNKLVQIYGQGESPMTITHLSREMHADRSHPRWEQRGAFARHRRSRRNHRQGRHGDVRLLEQPRGHGEVPARRLAVDRRCRGLRRGGAADLEGPFQGHDHIGRLEHLSARDRGRAEPPSRRRRMLGGRPPASGMGRGSRGLRGGARGPAAGAGRARPALPRQRRTLQAAQGLQVRRRAAQEQLRQDPQDGAQEAALEAREEDPKTSC